MTVLLRQHDGSSASARWFFGISTTVLRHQHDGSSASARRFFFCVSEGATPSTLKECGPAEAVLREPCTRRSRCNRRETTRIVHTITITAHHPSRRSVCRYILACISRLLIQHDTVRNRSECQEEIQCTVVHQFVCSSASENVPPVDVHSTKAVTTLVGITTEFSGSFIFFFSFLFPLSFLSPALLAPILHYD